MGSPFAPMRLSSLSSYWPREAVSVLLPGSVLTIELVAIVRPAALQTVASSKLGTVATAIALVAVVAAAYIVGHTSRLLAFAAFQKVWRPAYDKDSRDDALKHVLKQVDGETFDSAIDGSPIACASDPTGIQYGYWLYCKYWLRLHAPEVAVDDFETDINLSYAFVLPVLLSVTALWRVLDARDQPLSLAAYAFLMAVAAVAAVALAWRGKSKQADETNAALERYMMVRLMRDDPGPRPDHG